MSTAAPAPTLRVIGSNGRVEEFGIEVEPGAYRPSSDLSGYDGFEGRDDTFFREIVVSFEVHDVERYHPVPVVVSGFGHSTYLGNRVERDPTFPRESLARRSATVAPAGEFRRP